MDSIRSETELLLLRIMLLRAKHIVMNEKQKEEIAQLHESHKHLFVYTEKTKTENFGNN